MIDNRGEPPMIFDTITDSIDADFENKNYPSQDEIREALEIQRPRLTEILAEARRQEQEKLDRATGKTALHGTRY